MVEPNHAKRILSHIDAAKDTTLNLMELFILVSKIEY